MSTLTLFAMMCIFGCLVVEAKVFSRCELAKELAKNKHIPRGDIKHYVCIAHLVSNYNSNARKAGSSQGSFNYGIFQISSGLCVDPNKPSSNICRVSCSALLNDNIADDITCAAAIKVQYGFSAWTAWRNTCKGKNLEGYISGCGI